MLPRRGQEMGSLLSCLDLFLTAVLLEVQIIDVAVFLSSVMLAGGCLVTTHLLITIDDLCEGEAQI